MVDADVEEPPPEGNENDDIVFTEYIDNIIAKLGSVLIVAGIIAPFIISVIIYNTKSWWLEFDYTEYSRAIALSDESFIDLASGVLKANTCLLDCAPSCGDPNIATYDYGCEWICSSYGSICYCAFQNNDWDRVAYTEDQLNYIPCLNEMPTCLSECSCNVGLLQASYILYFILMGYTFGGHMAFRFIYCTIAMISAALIGCGAPNNILDRINHFFEHPALPSVFFCIMVIFWITSFFVGWVAQIQGASCSDFFAFHAVPLLTLNSLGLLMIGFYCTKHLRLITLLRNKVAGYLNRRTAQEVAEDYNIQRLGEINILAPDNTDMSSHMYVPDEAPPEYSEVIEMDRHDT